MAVAVRDCQPVPRPATLAPFPCGGQCKAMPGKDKSREERLAAALRENLKRRKAQARAVDVPSSRPADED